MAALSTDSLQGRRAVFTVTALPVGPPFLGAHHIAAIFQRQGARNLWLSPPVTPLHLLGARHRRSAKGRFQLWKSGGQETEGIGLGYAPFTPLPCADRPGLRSEAVARLSLKVCLPPLGRWCRHRGFDRPDAMIIHSLHLAPLAEVLRPKRTVLYLMDELSAMPGVPEGLLRIEEEWIRRADGVLCTDISLAERSARLRGGNEGVVFAGNGCHFESFAAGKNTPEPEDIRAIPHPRAVFFGSGSSWVNRPLVREMADRMPDVHFLMVGPEMDPVGVMAGLPNLHVLPGRPHGDLPALCGHCDVGIVPYVRGPFHDAADRIKVYEMMASGLPVVITKSRRYDHDNAPVIQVEETAEDFARGLREALAKADTFAEQTYAKEHTWEKVAEEMAALAFER
jgi:glycosyltransferase involved in cell wall biosynthesis